MCGFLHCKIYYCSKKLIKDGKDDAPSQMSKSIELILIEPSNNVLVRQLYYYYTGNFMNFSTNN